MSRPTTITPHAYRAEMRAWRERMGQLRWDLSRARTLRITGRALDLEEAEGMLDALYWEHRTLQSTIRWLRSVSVVKGNAMSPAAWARHEARLGR